MELRDKNFFTKKRVIRIIRRKEEDTEEIVTPDKPPKGTCWSFFPLYKFDVSGEMRMWQVRCKNGTVTIDHGRVGGAITTDPVTIEESRKGESSNEKAYNKALSLFNHKIEREQYALDLNSDTQRKENAPMLAGRYGGSGSATVKEKEFETGVAVEPKIDGFRFVTKYRNGKTKYLTRQFTEYNFPHIDKEIIRFFGYFPHDTELDGEMWIEGLTFPQMSSIVKPTKNINPRLTETKYYIFDIISNQNPNTTFQQRYDAIINAWDSYCGDWGEPDTFRIVRAEIAHSDEEVWKLHDKYVEMGYEGAMVKKLHAKYIHGRTNNQLKVKRFFDDEGIIVDVESAGGKETGHAKLIIKDKNGNILKGRPAASFAERAWMLQHSEEIIGKKVRYKYQEISEYGVPRFIVIMGIIDE